MAFTETKAWGEEVIDAQNLTRIEANTQANHDASVANTSDIATNIDQPVLTTSDVTFNTITTTGSVEIEGALEPTTTPVDYQTTTPGVYIVPRGIYDIYCEATGFASSPFAMTAKIEKTINGRWYTVSGKTDSLHSGIISAIAFGIVSTGSNVRVTVSYGTATLGQATTYQYTKY